MSSVMLLPARSPCPAAVCGRPRAAATGYYHQTLGLYRFPAPYRQRERPRSPMFTDEVIVRVASLRSRDRLVGHRDQRGGVGEYLLLGGEEPVLGGGQGDGLRRPRVAGRRAGEPQRGGEVAADAAAEGADVRLTDAEPLLDDADQRGV